MTPATQEWWVEDHLQWRPLTNDDVQELDALRDQIEAFDDAVLTSAERAFASSDVELEGFAVGGWDGYGNLMAFGWNLVDGHDRAPHLHILGGVHPSHRHLGLGRALIAWHVRHATRWRDRTHPGRTVYLECHVEERESSFRQLLSDAGFRPERWFVDMYRPLPLDHPPTAPEGVELVPFTMGHAEQLMDLHRHCFDNETASLDAQEWLASLRREHFRPEWSWLAFVDGAMVGYALSGIDDAAALDDVMEGWTDRVGVHPAYRGRGISSALLERTLSTMAEAGCPGAGIGVDTSQPRFADSLHHRLGYEVRDVLVLWRLELPAPG